MATRLSLALDGLASQAARLKTTAERGVLFRGFLAELRNLSGDQEASLWFALDGRLLLIVDGQNHIGGGQ